VVKRSVVEMVEESKQRRDSVIRDDVAITYTLARRRNLYTRRCRGLRFAAIEKIR